MGNFKKPRHLVSREIDESGNENSTNIMQVGPSSFVFDSTPPTDGVFCENCGCEVGQTGQVEQDFDDPKCSECGDCTEYICNHCMNPICNDKHALHRCEPAVLRTARHKLLDRPLRSIRRALCLSLEDLKPEGMSLSELSSIERDCRPATNEEFDLLLKSLRIIIRASMGMEAE